MQDRLPPLTHLQFLVLNALADAEQPGRAVRATLAEFGVKRSAPAFYQMMARLERDGLVDGWYEQVPSAVQSHTERRYRATPAGLKAWTATRGFYARVAALSKPRTSNA